jgi:hypothetical protein
MQAIENEDITNIMSIISKDYDGFGMDYDRLERWFINHFQRYEGIKIFIPVKKIHVNKETAVCSLRASIQARNPSSGEPELIYGFSTWGDEIILDLVKSDGKWMFISAHP